MIDKNQKLALQPYIGTSDFGQFDFPRNNFLNFLKTDPNFNDHNPCVTDKLHKAKIYKYEKDGTIASVHRSLNNQTAWAIEFSNQTIKLTQFLDLKSINQQKVLPKLYAISPTVEIKYEYIESHIDYPELSFQFVSQSKYLKLVEELKNELAPFTELASLRFLEGCLFFENSIKDEKSNLVELAQMLQKLKQICPFPIVYSLAKDGVTIKTKSKAQSLLEETRLELPSSTQVTNVSLSDKHNIHFRITNYGEPFACLKWLSSKARQSGALVSAEIKCEQDSAELEFLINRISKINSTQINSQVLPSKLMHLPKFDPCIIGNADINCTFDTAGTFCREDAISIFQDENGLWNFGLHTSLAIAKYLAINLDNLKILKMLSSPTFKQRAFAIKKKIEVPHFMESQASESLSIYLGNNNNYSLQESKLKLAEVYDLNSTADFEIFTQDERHLSALRQMGIKPSTASDLFIYISELSNRVFSNYLFERKIPYLANDYFFSTTLLEAKNNSTGASLLSDQYGRLWYLTNYTPEEMKKRLQTLLKDWPISAKFKVSTNLDPSGNLEIGKFRKPYNSKTELLNLIQLYKVINNQETFTSQQLSDFLNVDSAK